MELIAYFEGADEVKEWLTRLLGLSITFKKLPARNDSNDFAKLPAYVADILYLDKPDIILSVNIDNIHEKPIFSIEFAGCTPQYQHALQRFSRMMASVVIGCPSAIIMPLQKRENQQCVRLYQRSSALEYGAVRLMDIYSIPAFVFDWPDSDGVLINERDMNLPEISSGSIQELKSLILKAIIAFRNLDYIACLWRLPETRALLEKTRTRAYTGGAPTISRPGGGTGADSQSNLELVNTEEILEQVKSTIPRSDRLLAQLPEFIQNREKSLVFYPTRITAHAGDPYVGMIGYYDIAFCRIGPSTRDRTYNLIAYSKGVSITEIEGTMKSFNANTCPFPDRINNTNILPYSYHLKYCCRDTKIKPVRIYSELADIVIFDDGLIFNVG